MNAMLFLAVTTLDKLKQVPPRVWWWVALGVAVFIAFVFVLQWLANANKVIMAIVAFAVCAVVFFSWIYNRNEPAFLTPLVEDLEPFFPQAGAYERSAGKPLGPAEPAKPTTTTTIPPQVY